MTFGSLGIGDKYNESIYITRASLTFVGSFINYPLELRSFSSQVK